MSMGKIENIIKAETRRQKETINLIPSENYVSRAVLKALGSPLTNKYAEGKPHQRYYFGNEHIDEVEDQAKALALKAFGLSARSWSVNVQPYAGSIANLAVYAALVKPGDTILAMSLAHGGHLTHGHKASVTGKLWDFVHYGVEQDGLIDYKKVAHLARVHEPKLIVCGATAYSRAIDFEAFAKIAKSVDAYLMADISHIAGLVVGKAHASPFPWADVVTTTTHKTLRGPRAAMMLSRKLKVKSEKFQKETLISDLVDRAVFPGLQGGPHMHTIAAMAQAFSEALEPKFKRYARQVVKNAKAFAKELERFGFTLVTGGTDNHLILADMTRFGMGGQRAGELLERAGIVVNKNMIPYDARTPNDPSGIRLGTPAVTTRGMKEPQMREIAKLIAEVIIEGRSPESVALRVRALARKFPLWY